MTRKVQQLANCELDILRVMLQKQKIALFDPLAIETFLQDTEFSALNAKTLSAQLQSSNSHYSTPQRFAEAASLALHHAARVGDLFSVMKLVAQGHNVNEKDLFHSTPLHMAAMYGHKAIAEFLIQKGANIDAKTYKMEKFALTPLDLAAQYAPSTDMFSFLLKKGAQPEHWDLLVFALLDKAVDSYENHDYKTFELIFNKIDIASQNKNALWVYTESEVKPILVLCKVLASEIADGQYHQRLMQTVNSLSLVDKSSLAARYMGAKNLLHAFPSGETYYYHIGPNKVKMSAQGYYSVMTVELAAKTLGAYLQKQLFSLDSKGYQVIKTKYPLSNETILKNAESFTQEKLTVFQKVETIFKLGDNTILKAALYDNSVELFKRYEAGETLLLPSGWEGHAIEVIINKPLNLFMVANSGERFEDVKPGLNAFNLQFPLTADNIYSILTNEEQINLEFKHFYDLGLEQNQQYSFLHPSQTFGNCSWYSQQIAQKALLYIELSQSINNPALALSIAEQWFAEYTEFHLTHVLKTYLNDPFLEVGALGDILVNYHMKLESPAQQERAKLILDVLTDNAHKNEFNNYVKENHADFTPELKKYITDNHYKITDLMPSQDLETVPATTPLNYDDVIQDNPSAIINPPTLPSLPVFEVAQLAEEPVIVVL